MMIGKQRHQHLKRNVVLFVVNLVRGDIVQPNVKKRMNQKTSRRQACIQKLLDKGFDWADVHLFIVKHNLSVLFVPPPPDMNLIWFGSTEEQKEKWDGHYKKEYEIEDKKWEEASIAADSETHK